MRRRKRIFILKIDLPALLAISFFAGLIFFYLIPGFEKVMMERKRDLIHEITSSAYSLLWHYNDMETSGVLGTEEAKEQAKSAISAIRYGATLKDYFWITDKHPRMIIHPYRPDLNGADLTNFRDSNGKNIFVEFVKAVSPTGESYVDYMWQWNDDSTRNVPKLSYVKLFEPWGWIIGTGIYTEDVRSEIHRMELRALIISGIIGIVIVILLIVISGQSHTIEQRRNRAEEELQKSRELYRTLAEAASEGVLIWSKHGLQANKILLSWLDYTEEELKNIEFREIFNLPEINEFNDSDSLYDDLNSRRFVESFIKIKNGNLINTHADFSRILMGAVKAVLVVVRPVNALSTPSGFSPAAILLNNTGTGFFRITYGRKGRFLYASKPAVQILGYDNLQDLLPHNIESLIINPVQLKVFKSQIMTKEPFNNEAMLIRQKGGKEIWVLISIVVVESDSSEIWCDGAIELMAASAFQNELFSADLNTFGASFILESPVSNTMHPVIKCSEDMPVADAMAKMKEEVCPFIIVMNKNDEPLGVGDATEIGSRLAEGGAPETEIFRWMNSPPDFIPEKSRVVEAFRMIGKNRKKCLLAINDKNKTTGIITSTELVQALFCSPELISTAIAEARSAASLHKVFIDSRKIIVSMILGRADPYSVSLYISSIADAICNRVVKLCLEEAGEPPCSFAFVQTGSAGRREQTLFTDQDNAIIFEQCEGEQLLKAYHYFPALGKKVNEMLADAGFRLCKGENMAGNSKWCQPVNNWKKYFSDWIKMPGPDELLDVSIFFDFRFCFGNQALSEELSDYVKNDLKTSDIFFHHMASAWKPFSPSLKNTQEGKTDIKKILMPLTGIVRLYSLRYGSEGFSSVERILELYYGNHLNDHLLRDSIKAWKDLTSLRLLHQAACINKNSDIDNIIDFNIIGSDMRYFAEQAVKTINELMLKAGSDYYSESL